MIGPVSAKPFRSLLLCAPLFLSACQSPQPVQTAPTSQQPVPLHKNRVQLTPEPKGFEALVLRAVETYPAVQAKRAGLEAAQARLSVVSRPEDPEIRLNYAQTTSPGTALVSEDRSEKAEIGVRFFTPHPLAGWAARNEAKIAVDMAEDRLQQVRFQRQCALEQAHVDYRYAKEHTQLLKRLLELSKSEYQRVQEQAELNLATTTERAKLGSDYLNTDLRWSRSQQDLMRNETQLAAMLHVDVHHLSEYPELSNWPDLPGVIPGTAFLQEQAVEQHPDLSIRRKEVASAQARLNQVSRSKVPWPSFLQLSYALEQQEPKDETWSASAALSFPIFSWILPDESDVLKAEVAEQKSLLDSAELLMRERVSTAATTYRAALKAFNHFEQESQPIFEQLQQAQADAEAQSEQTAYTELTNRILSLQLSELELRYACHTALLSLEQVLSDHLPAP